MCPTTKTQGVLAHIQDCKLASKDSLSTKTFVNVLASDNKVFNFTQRMIGNSYLQVGKSYLQNKYYNLYANLGQLQKTESSFWHRKYAPIYNTVYSASNQLVASFEIYDIGGKADFVESYSCPYKYTFLCNHCSILKNYSFRGSVRMQHESLPCF